MGASARLVRMREGKEENVEEERREEEKEEEVGHLGREEEDDIKFRQNNNNGDLAEHWKEKAVTRDQVTAAIALCASLFPAFISGSSGKSGLTTARGGRRRE